MSTDHEYELIGNLTRGDAVAFSGVYDLYKDKVFAFAYTLTKSRETAEEVVQEVFLKLWERREQIKVEGSFLAYVKRITYNQVMDFFRKAGTDRKLQQQIVYRMEQIRSTGEEVVLSRELQAIYQRAIDSLPAQQRKVYLLSREADLSYEEIATELGLSRNTVRNHLAEAVKNIRAYVTQHGDLAILIIAICMSRGDRS